MLALGAVGVFGGMSGLGQDVQAGEEAQALITVEITDVTPPLLVQKLQSQQAQHGTGGRDHRRAGIARHFDEVIEAEVGQQRQEQEDARDSTPQPSSWFEAQAASVGDLGRLGTRRWGSGRTSVLRGREQRGGVPARHWIRNAWIT